MLVSYLYPWAISVSCHGSSLQLLVQAPLWPVWSRVLWHSERMGAFILPGSSLNQRMKGLGPCTSVRGLRGTHSILASKGSFAELSSSCCHGDQLGNTLDQLPSPLCLTFPLPLTASRLRVHKSCVSRFAS